MGITNFSVSVLDLVIKSHKPKSVCELGDQILYTSDGNYGKYANLYYENMGIESHRYVCMDLNGENGAMQIDMGKLISPIMLHFDLVTDFGFSEHVGTDGHFDWQAIYNCWLNKFNLCKDEGIIISENPLTGFWPGHGWNYHTTEFYHELEACSGLRLLKWGTVCAMGNCETGQNAWAVQAKVSNEFPSLEIFKTLSIKQS